MTDKPPTLANILAGTDVVQGGAALPPYWGDTQWRGPGSMIPLPQKDSPAAHSLLDLINYLSMVMPGRSVRGAAIGRDNVIAGRIQRNLMRRVDKGLDDPGALGASRMPKWDWGVAGPARGGAHQDGGGPTEMYPNRLAQHPATQAVTPRGPQSRYQPELTPYENALVNQRLLKATRTPANENPALTPFQQSLLEEMRAQDKKQTASDIAELLSRRPDLGPKKP